MKDFYLCEVCGNIAEKINDTGIPIICCGKPMVKMEPQTTDSTNEKHVPLIDVEGNKVTVTVGSTLHPMVAEHYITMIVLETDQGTKRQFLSPGAEPKACFTIGDDEKVVGAFELCNIHGLWKSEK
ncbi:MAG: desulfoferrodoxin Dfx [Clostridiales bacterium]|jgi:superoxide reductase|nr:desulfoferrodoxin Dfx [Clostridiales bacterium]